MVVTQKIVSKAEGQVVVLSTVTPSAFAEQIAERYEKDPRLVEVVLRESSRVVRMDQGVIITETRHGFICANSGVDQSTSRRMAKSRYCRSTPTLRRRRSGPQSRGRPGRTSR